MPVIVPRKNGAFMNVSYGALESAHPDLTEEALQAVKRLLRELKLKGGGDFWLGMHAMSHSDMWWHMGSGIYVVVTKNGPRTSLRVKLPDAAGPAVPLRGLVDCDVFVEVECQARRLHRVMRQAVRAAADNASESSGSDSEDAAPRRAARRAVAAAMVAPPLTTELRDLLKQLEMLLA